MGNEFAYRFSGNDDASLTEKEREYPVMNLAG